MDEKELKAELAKAQARADAAEEAKKAADNAAEVARQAASAERMDARVAERVALVESARVVLGAEYRADGKTDRDVRVAAIVKLVPEFRADGKSDDYVTARFDAEIERAKAATAALGAVNAAAASPSRSDAADEDKIELARIRNIEACRNAWKVGA